MTTDALLSALLASLAHDAAHAPEAWRRLWARHAHACCWSLVWGRARYAEAAGTVAPPLPAVGGGGA